MDPTAPSPFDRLSRPLSSLRVSVTDRCNLRCRYCMPEENYPWLQRQMLLSFEELARLVRLFGQLGVDRVRLTGGEPLLRKDLPDLIRLLKGEGIRELALTTNGLLLEALQEELFAAGLDRLTVSLDALEPELFRSLAGRGELSRALAGLRSVAGRPGLKIDTVVVGGQNESQLLPLLDLAREVQAEIRFIEYMDVGGATRWSPDQVVSAEAILARIAQREGETVALPGRGSAPAQRFQTPSGQVFGVIASVTQPFCRTCDRARLTADGQLLTCLYARRGRDLRAWLRGGLGDQEIVARLAEVWQLRRDRGAEERLELEQRGPLADVAELQENPHLEMHTRGG